MKHEMDQAERWQRLTQKQREVLDLVLERKTSKEIARVLGITMHAVDLRLTKARITLGARNRAQAALIYESLKRTYGKTTYGFPLLPGEPDTMPAMLSNEATITLAGGDRPDHSGPALEGYDALFRDLRRRDHGVSGRTVFMVFIVGIMVVVILIGLGIAQTLSKLISV